MFLIFVVCAYFLPLPPPREAPIPTRPLNWTPAGATAVQESIPPTAERERERERERENQEEPGSKKMGQALRRLFDSFSTKEMRVVMLGLDSAGKTTILYRLHLGEVLQTVPTVGFNVEKVQYKNVAFTVWDVGGQEKLRQLWRMYLSNSDALIYVVDSLDRERIEDARQEFQSIIKDPLMANSIILVLANKQDLKGSMSPEEVIEGLGLHDLKNRIWHIQGTCALRGEGLYDGLDWLASTLKQLQETGRATSIAGPSI
ncbi:ADP-ribosylation factor-like [Triticum dicoccoides]|uniref:ADP-ribosylation factor-like n=1 Tax=Triticum dicoccoides TaxID=85692 RepID=UPI00189173DB|nr:ADP-ribosylation factor-like [Triticum dicoccoides]